MFKSIDWCFCRGDRFPKRIIDQSVIGYVTVNTCLFGALYELRYKLSFQSGYFIEGQDLAQGPVYNG